MNHRVKPFMLFKCLIIVVSIVPMILTSQAAAKDYILVGGARPLSGNNAFFEENNFGPIYKMWAEDVNAEGGIYVKEYGKKLPVKLLIYDDKSDMATMSRLLERLILQDKVDIVLPPASTAFLFAAGAITNRHKKVLIGAEGGLSTVAGSMKGMPYFFGILNFADHYQMPVLADLFEDLGVKTAAIMSLDDLFGVEYGPAAEEEFKKKGIKVLMKESVPLDIKDVSPILKKAQSTKADAFCALVYPWIVFPTVLTSQAIGYNPKAMLLGPGGNNEAIKSVCGTDTVHGLMSCGAWSPKSSPAHKEFFEKYTARYPRQTLDWWGHNLYVALLQMMQGAIERSGTLDNSVLKDVLASEKFDTILGPTWFENQLLARECFSGQIGQWQNGEFEVIDPGEKRTAEPIFPKPPWPAPKENK